MDIEQLEPSFVEAFNLNYDVKYWLYDYVDISPFEFLRLSGAQDKNFILMADIEVQDVRKFVVPFLWHMTYGV